MCMIDDCESFAIWRNTFRKARKEHTCDECARKIAPGESYNIETGLLDGHWSQSKTCAHCYAPWLGRVLVGMNRQWTRPNGALMTIPSVYVDTLQQQTTENP